MALVCSTGVGGCCSMRSTVRQTHRRRPPLSPPPLLLVSLLRSRDGGGRRGAAQVVGARRGLSSRTRRLEERGKKGGLTTKPSKEELDGQGGGDGEGDAPSSASSMEGAFVGSPGGEDAALPPLPDLPGLTPDFWEGPQWDAFGFFVQYLWAFGIVFALISGGIAAATYNEGATDFKQTSVYKESIQSRELLEEPDSSGSEVFEANPTEAASNVE